MRNFAGPSLACVAAGALASLGARLALASTLVTPTYEITITENCPEGVVGCDDVTFVGKNLKTRKTIHLKGRSVMHSCPDDQGDGPGKTPCHHVGYEFRAGRTTYTVDDDGKITVIRGAKVVLEEPGKWNWE